MPHKEFLACKRYVELLKKEGIPVEENFLGVETSFKATIHEDSSSPIKIGILAEYDALPEIEVMPAVTVPVVPLVFWQLWAFIGIRMS